MEVSQPCACFQPVLLTLLVHVSWALLCARSCSQSQGVTRPCQGLCPCHTLTAGRQAFTGASPRPAGSAGKPWCPVGPDRRTWLPWCLGSVCSVRDHEATCSGVGRGPPAGGKNVAGIGGAGNIWRGEAWWRNGSSGLWGRARPWSHVGCGCRETVNGSVPALGDP